MATNRELAQGYLEQARVDLAGAAAMGASSPSTLAMLIQMVFEKYAKAVFLRQNPGEEMRAWAGKTHASASRLLLILRRQKRILAPLGGSKVWEDVLWVIPELERAHPQLAPREGPMLEYPWEDLHGQVRWPARDLKIAASLGDPRKTLGARVLLFLEKLGRDFDRIFA